MARFSLITLGLSILASSALASQHNVIMQREETIEKNSPLYDCHLACGDAILSAESDNYCSSSNFTSDLSTCLKCAETCEIWQYYGTDVGYAAGNCSDSATPSSSSSASSCASTTGSATTATNTAADTTTTTTSTATSTTDSTATASATSGAGATYQQNIVFPALIGSFVWALNA